MADSNDLEVARTLGELGALIRGQSERLDRQAADVVRTTAGGEAQLHEVKHELRQQMAILVAFDERLKAHTENDERNNAAILAGIRENRDSATSRQEQLKESMDEIKEVATDSKSKIDDLLSWRNKILGGLALVAIVFAVFGKAIADWVFRKLGI